MTYQYSGILVIISQALLLGFWAKLFLYQFTGFAFLSIEHMCQELHLTLSYLILLSSSFDFIFMYISILLYEIYMHHGYSVPVETKKRHQKNP